MFWSGNYIAVRELNSLLKEENVTLSQVLEADDIIQECKADNKALIQFLTKPEILADLITLMTEEPCKNVELASQYRLPNIACEVLTSHLSMLSDRLSLDATQMNRLCDFINRDPPLNPLLASYFSKTVEMLLEKSPKQDWCLHHIVCLRVLDFFKSRRDFLPNLLRHMSTSAIADIFKYLLRIDDLIKTVMEWLEEHQFLECLIQIICGTYVSETSTLEPLEKAERETSEKVSQNHTEDGDTLTDTEKQDRERVRSRVAAAASSNAAALLCDLLVNDCRGAAGGGWSTRPAAWRLDVSRGVSALLAAMFTSAPAARTLALVHGAQVLLALLHHDRDTERMEKGGEEEAPRGDGEERSSVELAVAPHLPLLHQALLQAPAPLAPLAHTHTSPRVGLARVQVAALLAHLAASEVEEVASTMLTLGTPGVLLDMFFSYPNNNFLHAQVYTLVKHALTNRVYRTQYARHLLIECDLLTRLMDVFEDNKNNKGGSSGVARAPYMGHVVELLGAAARALAPSDVLALSLTLPAALDQRWRSFLDDTLRPLLHQHDTPLGGYYPPENFYEVEIMSDTIAANYEIGEPAGGLEESDEDFIADGVHQMCVALGVSADSPASIADGLGVDDDDKLQAAKNNFLELASQRYDADMWEDSEEPDITGVSLDVRDVLEQHSPWASAESGAGGGEGWAQFGCDPFCVPPAGSDVTPASQDQHFAEFTPFWGYTDQGHENSTTELESNLRSLRLESEAQHEASSAELANNLLTAMSAMSPAAIANIVNANLTPPTTEDDAAHDPTQDNAQDPTYTTTQDNTHDPTHGNSQDPTPTPTQDNTQDSPPKPTQDNTQDCTQESSKVTSQDTAHEQTR